MEPTARDATETISQASIEQIEALAFTIPTDAPESDGTFAWDRTTIVVVHAAAAGVTGVGYTYADTAAAELIRTKLGAVVRGRRATDVEGCYDAMMQSVRNLGRQGIAAAAISAVDIALWDLKARLVGLPLVALLGGARDRIGVYGSGDRKSTRLNSSH